MSLTTMSYHTTSPALFFVSIMLFVACVMWRDYQAEKKPPKGQSV